MHLTDLVRRFRTAAVFAAVLAVLPSFATTRYVDYDNGADEGYGTSAPGWKTIAYAVANAVENDEIVLAKGTHVCTTNIVINKALHLRGAGENWETVFDAQHKHDVSKTQHVQITADGVLVNNMTFYRLCGGNYDNAGLFLVTGNSVVSNCVFTDCGVGAGGDNKLVIDMAAGTLTSCWITNNVCRYLPMVRIRGVVETKCENCVIANNEVKTSNTSGAYGLFGVNTGLSVVRNCTIVNNKVVGNYCGMGIYYSSGSANADTNPKIYNNIIWNNTNADGDVRNVYVRKWYTKSFNHNDTTMMRGSDNKDYELNIVPQQYCVTSVDCVTLDPMLDGNYMPGAPADTTVKTGAKTGTDKTYDYCISYDIFGNPRGDKPSMGAVQYVAQGGLTVVVAADKTEVRLPEAIQLSCQTEGEQGALSYAWDYNNDGQIDSTEAAPKLATVGTYDSLKVTVTDTATSKIAYYNGTLTVLPRYMTNVVVTADKTAVRYPGTITFSTAIGDEEAEGPFTYSWDLDGDGIEDSTAEHPVLDTIGSYVNPTLLRVTDANGLYSDKVVLKGTYTILPEAPQTYTVNVGDSFADAVSQAFDGDTILLKKGTHAFTDNVVIDRPITICGEGENWETVLDANHTVESTSLPHMKITANGVLVNNLTFYRLCGGGGHSCGLFVVTGNSVVSNCVFTGAGVDSGDNKLLVNMSHGTLTSCWITNNICRYAPLVQIEGVTNTVCENCVIANNSVMTDQASGCYGLFNVKTGLSLVRNCTVANNCTGKKNYGGLSIYYHSGAKNCGTHCKIYNTVVWGNTNSVGAVRNVCIRRWYADNFFFNDTSDKMLGDDYVEYDLNSHPGGYAGRECVTIDPAFDSIFGLSASAGETLKTGAKTGTDAKGIAYCTGYDIYGKERGDKPSMGAIQYVASSTLSAAINADKAAALPPETIVLTAVVEGTESENIAYAWDIDGDGEFDDGTDPTNILSKAGNYDAVKVRVTADGKEATAQYDGALTVYLDVAISADVTKVRQPGKITFSADVADAEAAQPFSYSWDLDGDGVEDSTEANPTLSAIGEYMNPTLLRLTDANGLMSDKIVLTGTFTILPETTKTITVNAGESIPDALAGAYDGDEIILGKGTHPVTSVIQVKRPIAIHGAGAKEDTILDANYGGTNKKFWHFDILSAGAKVYNLTFDRFGSTDGSSGFVRLYANSVVSNVVVRNGSCGWNQGNFVEMSAGLLTHSWITNNVAGYCAGVQMGGNSTMENCAILGNRSTYEKNYRGVALSFPSGSGTQTVRNCTIAYNTYVSTNDTAVYGRAWNDKAQWVHLYNNIVWSNSCTQTGARYGNAYNDAGQKWFVKNNCWDYTDTSKMRHPVDAKGDVGNVNKDPQFDAEKGAPWLSADSPCKNAGDDAYGSTAGVDLLGNPRKASKHIDIGAVECKGGGMLFLIK